ncbi:hypothetical protein ALC60_02639, partial [Trachymyrmex zeteki]
DATLLRRMHPPLQPSLLPPPPSALQCLGLGELLGGAQAESTEIVSTGAGNPKASVARIKVAGRFSACETVSLLSEGRTRTHVGRRANDKKSFTAADLEEETDDDDDDEDEDEDEDEDDDDEDDNKEDNDDDEKEIASNNVECDPTLQIRCFVDQSEERILRIDH